MSPPLLEDVNRSSFRYVVFPRGFLLQYRRMEKVQEPSNSRCFLKSITLHSPRERPKKTNETPVRMDLIRSMLEMRTCRILLLELVRQEYKSSYCNGKGKRTLNYVYNLICRTFYSLQAHFKATVLRNM